MVQFARPISDVAAGSWDDSAVGDNDGSHFDELIADDGSLTESDAVGNNTNTSNLDVELTNSGLTDPGGNINHIIRTRWLHDQAGRNMQANCELWQGVPGTGTLIATLQVDPDVGTTEATGAYTLTGTEADNITDYNDLHFRLWGRGTGGGPGRQLNVDLAEFEFPDGGTAHTATPTEAVGISDSTPHGLDAARSEDEAVGISDSTTRVHDAVRSRDEAVGITDDTPHVLDAVRSTDEAVGISDSVESKLVIQVEITESIGISDSTTRDLDSQRQVDEPVGITDDTTRVLDSVRQVDEPVGVTDDTPRVHDAERVIDESVGISDSTVDDLTQDKFETVTEAVGIADSTERVHDAIREVSEPVGVTDSILPARTIRVTITESIGISDSTSPAQDQIVEISEPVGISDDTAAARDLARTVTEPVGLNDDTAPATTAARTIIEPVGVTDTVTFTLGVANLIKVEITELIGITDSVVASGQPWWQPNPVGISAAPVGIDRRTPDKESPSS